MICGCCTGLTSETPSAVINRPGLSAISYRIGTHSRFKQSMLAALSDVRFAALEHLRTRADDDFTIALIDAVAVMADVLTFYQERLANETFLRTATERRSVLELARLIGYELRNGVAAGTRLAFTIDDAVGAPREAIIDVGTRVQSVPGQGEKPQTFETIEKIQARVEWNAIRPRLTKPQIISPIMNDPVRIKGTARLAKGDSLLIVTGDSADTMEKRLRRVADVTEDHITHQTIVNLIPVPRSVAVLETAVADLNPVISDGHMGGGAVTPPAETTRPLRPNPGIFAMRKRAALFGANAPDFKAMATHTQTAYPAEYEYPYGWDWPVPPFDRSGELYLDQICKEVKPDDWVVVSRPSTDDLITQIDTAQETAAAWFAMSGQVTAITLASGTADVKPPFMHELRQMRFYIAPEKLMPDDLPDASDVRRSPIELDGLIPHLTPGQTIMVSGARADAGGLTGAEAAVIANVTDSNGRTTIALVTDLQHPYVRETVRINANVATATHGETVQELLGGGDASAAFQTFRLRQTPLTYISAANPDGAVSTLEVRINDLLWHETPTLYGKESKDHVYIARRDDDGSTTVQFGDSVTGARLPSGQNNVRARYRKGIGLDGLIKTGQLSMLLTRPLGVKGVVNPQAATGAQDPEHINDARTNAPLKVLTLDRVVSLTDFENFARAFAGVAKALATWMWDGHSRSVFVTVAGPNGAAIEPASATYDNLLAAMRAAGDPFVELRVKTFRPATFRLAANVKIDSDFEADRVLTALEQMLRDRFTFAVRSFGQPIIMSEVISAIQAVPGVVAVVVDKLYRSGGTPSLQQRLLADLPVVGPNGQPLAAELLTLDVAPLDQLGVLA